MSFSGRERDSRAGEIARAARALRQRLESARLFGFDVPIVWPPLPLSAAPGAASPAGPPARAQPAGENGAPPGRARPSGADLDAERERRRALLAPIEAEVRACKACVLCEKRTRTVFGVGDPCARLMFIGEGPGEDEDRQGEPFVGRAGQLLTRMIQAMGLARSDVYIANIVKCRPPENRNPAPREMISCIPYLRRQIEVVAPEIICTLGNVPTRALLDTTLPISRLRGRFAEYRGIAVLPTFHPSYLLRTPEDKRLAWEDLKKAMERLGLRAAASDA